MVNIEREASLQSEKFQITRENARWSPACGVRNFHVQNEQNARAIIHLDMDCFYAAIEVRDRPSLRGKPVGVGGARERRGVLTTCNYEARKFGVRSAMPTFMALQRCPNLIVLPTRFDVYRREAAIIRGILYQFTSIIEPLSLDEAYLDVSLTRPRRQHSRRKSAAQFFARRNSHLPRGLVRTSSSRKSRVKLTSRTASSK